MFSVANSTKVAYNYSYGLARTSLHLQVQGFAARARGLGLPDRD